MKRIIAAMLSGILVLSGVTVYAVDRDYSTRTELASFVFDNTGKTAGEKVTDYFSEDLPKIIEHQSYDNCYENGIASLYGYEGLHWSDDICGDVGIQPQTNNFKLFFDSSGWQNIELSFDMGVFSEKITSAKCDMYLYNNNYSQMIEWYSFGINSGEMKHYHMDFTCDYVEDIYKKYNEIYVSVGCPVPFVINNIKISGIKSSDGSRAYYYGDADSDKKITITDATIIQKFAIGIGDDYLEGLHPYYYCDVNGDNRISILDVTCIQKYIANYNSETGKTGERVVLDLPPEWYDDM